MYQTGDTVKVIIDDPGIYSWQYPKKGTIGIIKERIEDTLFAINLLEPLTGYQIRFQNYKTEDGEPLDECFLYEWDILKADEDNN